MRARFARSRQQNREAHGSMVGIVGKVQRDEHNGPCARDSTATTRRRSGVARTHAFAHRYAEELGLGPDPRHWDAAGVVSALILLGHDVPGDFVIGDAAVQRVQRAALSAPPSIDSAMRAEASPTLAAAALAGDVAASSAGGEQPKFTTCLRDRDTYRHAIVKFSPPRDTAIGQRWADCSYASISHFRRCVKTRSTRVKQRSCYSAVVPTWKLSALIVWARMGVAAWSHFLRSTPPTTAGSIVGTRLPTVSSATNG